MVLYFQTQLLTKFYRITMSILSSSVMQLRFSIFIHSFVIHSNTFLIRIEKFIRIFIRIMSFHGISSLFWYYFALRWFLFLQLYLFNVFIILHVKIQCISLVKVTNYSLGRLPDSSPPCLTNLSKFVIFWLEFPILYQENEDL